MKDLWKREVKSYLPKEEKMNIQESKGFQKKIDPIIEEIFTT